MSREKFSSDEGISIFDIKSGRNDDGRHQYSGVRFFTIADAVSLWIARGDAMLPSS